MNWFKVFAHDLRGGILRRRYLLVPMLFCMPCFECLMRLNGEVSGSWMDYLMFCFKGSFPTTDSGSFEFPILWFLIMGGCMFLNLDYPLNDLTEAGQQVIVRSGNRRGWFLSKCAWNLLSCGVYFLLGTLTCLVFALLSGGSSSLINTPAVTERTLQLFVTAPLTIGQALLVAVVLPYLTIAALNLLQMALCLVMKPIFSFLICICILISSAFFSSPYGLGNGAMVVRSGILAEGFLAPTPTLLVCLGAILVSIIIGIIRFERMDFLRYEG